MNEFLNKLPLGIKVTLGFSSFEYDLDNTNSAYNKTPSGFIATIYHLLLHKKNT